jgi:O-antigen ligase
MSRLEAIAAPDHRLSTALASLTAALAPAYVIRWHLGFYPTTLLEVAILATITVFAMESWRAGSIPEWRSPLVLPAAIFLVAGALSVLVAPSSLAALGLYRAYLVEPVLFGLVLVAVLRLPGRAHLVVAGFWVGGAVLGVANIVAVLRVIASHTFRTEGTPPVAIYSVANAVALFLVPLVAVAGSLLLYERRRPVRVTALVFLAIAVPAVVLTFSRGGWLALAAVAIGLAVSHPRRLWLLAALLATALTLGLVPAIRQRALFDLRFNSGESLNGRVRLWSGTVEMLRHRPITGAGLGGFTDRMGATFKNPFQITPIFPHNIVLNFWSELGLLGLLAFGWIVVATALAAWRGWRRGAPEWRPLQLGVMLALLAVVVHGLVDVPYFKNDLALEFWGLVAVPWAAWRWAAAQGAVETRAPFSPPMSQSPGRTP